MILSESTSGLFGSGQLGSILTNSRLDLKEKLRQFRSKQTKSVLESKPEE